MTLLTKLQNALNKVDGNVLTMDDDRGYDEYLCSHCQNRVYENQYNHKKSMCFRCWYDETEEV